MKSEHEGTEHYGKYTSHEGVVSYLESNMMNGSEKNTQGIQKF